MTDGGQPAVAGAGGAGDSGAGGMDAMESPAAGGAGDAGGAGGDGAATSDMGGAPDSAGAAAVGGAGASSGDGGSSGEAVVAGAAGAGGASGEPPHITSSITVVDMTVEQFTDLCDARGGTVEVIASCNGLATGKGFAYDSTVDLLSEHTCAGANTCTGWNCILD